LKAIWDVNKNFNIDKDRNLGNTYTHPFVSDKICSKIKNKKQKRILDPSVGTGSFYYACLDNIDEYLEYDCYDIEKTALDMIEVQKNTNLYHKDFLLSKNNKKYSLIITNPPYISYGNIKHDSMSKSEYIDAIKDNIDFDALGIKREDVDLRSDIYIYFYLKCLSHLEDGGELIFLCADKWLETRYGDVLRKILGPKTSNHLKLNRIITSNFYPFFRDDTNAIGVYITNDKGNDKNNRDIILNSVTDTEFSLNDKIIKVPIDEPIRNTHNMKNRLIMYNESYEYTQKITKDFEPLSEYITLETAGLNFASLLKDNKIQNKKEKGNIKLFYQKQARVNSPVIYRENLKEEDLEYYVKYSDINLTKYKVYKNSVFYTMAIDLYPRLFTYKEECVLSSKYVRLNPKSIDSEVIPILIMSLPTLLVIEAFIKNGTKRSGRKNKRGVIKEVGGKQLLNLPVFDFNILTDQEKTEILENYEKYKNLTFFNIEDLIKNKNYLKNQEIICKKLNIDIEEIKGHLLHMYNVRIRDLEKLGLELID